VALEKWWSAGERGWAKGRIRLRESLKMNDESNGKENEKRNGRENDERKVLTYRILRYVPNLVRDEWVNIGVLLEDGPSARRAIKLIEEDSEFARVRRLNPAMDDSLLRGLAGTFDAELRKLERFAEDLRARLQ
jgi:hypothetical protein